MRNFSSWTCAVLFFVILTLPSEAQNLQPPSLLTPGNGATEVVLDGSLGWASVSSATMYQVQLSTSTSFTTTLLDQTVTSLNISFSNLTSGTVHYWRVKASNDTDVSDWSDVWSFTTKSGGGTLAAPLLSSPVNGSSSVAQSGSLSWQSVSSATKYCVQLSLSTSFTTTVVDQETSSLNVSYSGLSAQTVYYWRVKAKDGGTESAWSSVWHFTTGGTGATLAAPILSSPSNGGSGVGQSGSLSWQSVSSATKYCVQLSLSTTFTTTVLDQETTSLSVSYSGLSAQSVYYWRVKAKDGGTESAWSSVWQFTTGGTGATLAAPILSSPSNGSSGVSQSGSLSWQSVSSATKYCVQLSLTSGFTAVVLDRETSSLSVLYSGLVGHHNHYWRVKAKDGSTESAWSSVWQFSTSSGATLAAPIQSTPANGSSGVGQSGSLSWLSVSSASKYCVQVSLSTSFTTTLLDQETTSLSLSYSGLSAQTDYYWRVKAKDGAIESSWSSVWHFTTGGTAATLAAPNLSSPANGSSGVGRSGSLSWQSVSSATKYCVQLSLSTSFTTTVLDQETASLSINYGGLAAHQNYYWRVKAKDGGSESSWSSVWQFTTGSSGATLAAPNLSAPANGSSDVGQSGSLSWQSVSSATKYCVQLSLSTSFTTTVLYKETTALSISYSGLSPHQNYYWRVKAKDGGGESPWSTVWNFTTGTGATLAAPQLVSPADNAGGVPRFGKLIWASVSSATSYCLEVSLSTTFTTSYIKLSTSLIVRHYENLAANTRYYWRVKAKDGSIESAWSPIWSFTTESGSALAVPVLISPSNGSSGVSQSGSLGWLPVSSATKYCVQLSPSTSFTTTVLDQETTSLSISYSGLAAMTNYFWRVKAKNGSTESAWSGAFQFQTGNSPKVEIRLRVLLAGAFDRTSTGAMLRDINHLIPNLDPYGNNVSAATIPASAVDWIELELRSNTQANTLVFVTSALLKFNGIMMDASGNNRLRVDQSLLAEGDYYIVIRHRNHLAVMSADLVHIDDKGILYSFTGSQSQAYERFQAPMKRLAAGIFGMVAGDATGDGVVNARDRVQVRRDGFKTGYLDSDLNLDGIVDRKERPILRRNRFRVSQVP